MVALPLWGLYLWVGFFITQGVIGMLKLKDKQSIVTQVKKTLEDTVSVVLADARGVNANSMTKLRKEAREANVEIRVVRNSLIRRAFEGTSYDCLLEVCVGPTLIGFSKEHPGAAARIFKEFANTEKDFEIKALSFEGEFIAAKDIDRLASLPTYEEGLAKLMSVMKEAAAGKLVRTLAAVRDQKQEEAA